MTLLRKLMQLSAVRRRLLLKGWFQLLGVAVAIRILPVSSITRMGWGPVQRRRVGGATPLSLRDLCWSVQAAGRRVPGATCLAQAIVLRRMLMTEGYTAEIQLGVQLEAERLFRAHAWVISGGQVIVGQGEVSAYQPLRPTAG